MEMIKRACRNTLMLKVYMAKLAVLISVPNIGSKHCGASIGEGFEATVEFLAGFFDGGSNPVEHGKERSVERKPRSRASCSRVIGMKDPSVNGQ
jgi:hypothetical protein